MDAEEIQRLRGRRVTVVSMLDDRLTVATLEIDCERVGARTLVTPVRHTVGKSGPNNYPPKFVEMELVKEIDDKQVRAQVEAVAGARSLARLGSLPFVFQRYDGTWFENACWPGVSENLEDKLRERAQADIRFLKSEIKHGDIVLIECPDTDRRFRNISWSSRYAKKITGFEGILEQEVFKLFPDDATMGACEYVARIFERLPTYFDHIYGIEIAALDFDGDANIGC